MEAVGRANRHCSGERSWVGKKHWEGDDDGDDKMRRWSMEKGMSRGAHSLINLSNNVDELLYKNLLEIVPLVESIMDERCGHSRSFHRHASLVYTPTPAARDRPLKKVTRTPVSKGRLGHSMLSRGKRGELVLWDKDGNYTKSREPRSEGITMLSLPTKHQASEKLVSRMEQTTQLHHRVEELERKLQERQKRLESMVNRDEVHRLRADLGRVHNEISRKDHEIHELHATLSNKENEFVTVLAQLEEVGLDALEMGRKTTEMERELIGLQYQLKTLMFQLELIGPCNMEEFQAYTDGVGSRLTMGDVEDNRLTSHMHGAEYKDMEQVRRMYMAAIIASKQKPEVQELVTLEAEFRAQMHSFTTQSKFSRLRDDVV